MLGELIGSIVKLLDTDSHIIHGVALIFNVEIVAQEYTIVHVDNEDDVITKEDTVIDYGRSLAQ
jgi:hypothetical protein